MPGIIRQVRNRCGARNVETVADVALAATQQWGIHREDERSAARPLGALYQRARKAAVAVDVQLKPERAAGDRSYLLDRRRGERGNDHPRADSRGGSCGREFAVAMREPLKRHGRDEQRTRQVLTRHGHRQGTVRDISQHPISQHEALPRIP